jgi:hypothetical protein
MIYRCRTDLRRTGVADHPVLNGLDFLEVIDNDAQPDDQRQRHLRLRFVKPLAPSLRDGLTPEQVRIEGGERVRGVRAVAVAPTVDDQVLAVEVDRPGDFSRYTLRLVRARTAADVVPPAGIDELLAAVEFSFKVECGSDFDCRPRPAALPPPMAEPVIDYLAKDYASLRRLLLDRLALLVPDWTDRSPADLGMVLVELLAYVGDYLSYTQDAVATEAYLGTARRRVSVRRHARLVDYAMHDGGNARTWVQLQVAQDIGPAAGVAALPEHSQLLTTSPGLPLVVERDSQPYRQARAAGAVAFETMVPVIALYQAHNRMPFYTWDGQDCVLPAGATAATLAGHFPRLRPGQVLILAEERDPAGGPAGRPDPAQRHAVRLTGVEHTGDGGGPLTDPLHGRPITEIRWDPRDALPFPLCVATTVERHGQVVVEDIAVALGNIVLADHGASVAGADHDELLGPVPAPTLRLASPDGCQDPAASEPVPARFRPTLRLGPVTQAAPRPDADGPAGDVFRWSFAEVLPEVWLTDSGTGQRWSARRDLLGSDQTAQEFVAEVEEDGRTFLRFGDDTFGEAPAPGTRFDPTYRVGNGVAGNIGADTLGHLVGDGRTARLAGVLVAVTNPLPARGGTEPETIEEVRSRSPFAFRVQARAVTPADYEQAARIYPSEEHPDVQQAVATFRWTGSWYTVFLTVDRRGGLDVDADFETKLRAHLERFRLAGHDLEIEAPRYVPLELALTVRVAPEYLRGDVEQALDDVLTSRTLPDGRRGPFHPDNLSFGQTVYLSPLLAAAQAVTGVVSVRATQIGRQGSQAVSPAPDQLALGRLEIARLDNDPNFPDRGVLRLTMEGGK